MTVFENVAFGLRVRPKGERPPAEYPSASTVGGTSASSPMWAARAAVSGQVIDSAFIYGSNITSGNNGAPALTGFDLATGRGSWNGTTP